MSESDQRDGPVTRALHAQADWAGALSSVTPLFQASAFQTGSPHFYTRKSNPNSEEFERILIELEGCRHALAVTTGMTAISAVLTTLLRSGDVLTVNRDIYGCSYKFFYRVAQRLGCEVQVLNLSLPEEHARIHPKSRIVLFESPTNPFLKTVDISAVSLAAKRANPACIVVVDNTWATPLFQRPLQHGADVSLYSATKYFSGHSDVMGGVICTDRADLDEEFRQERFYAGLILDPHSAWLLCRSMKTFAIRMRAHESTTRRMAEFLPSLPQISKVYYPKVDGRQLTGYGGIVFVDLRDDLRGCYSQLTRNLKLFTTGTGMAAVTSMVAQPFSGSHASMNAEEKAAMGLNEGLVRLCFGLEEPEDLMRDLRTAFSSLRN